MWAQAQYKQTYWYSCSEAISSEKSALKRQNCRSKAVCLFLGRWKCYSLMWWGLLSGELCNCWGSWVWPVQTWWTAWFQMSLWAVGVHSQNENISAGLSSQSQKMLELTLGRVCLLFLLFLANYSVGQGHSLSMNSKLKPENGLSSNCTY